MNASNSNRRGISHIPVICRELGLQHVILCPGSRNAPLIMAFGRTEGIKIYSITDERSAAYFAIGIAQAVHGPVAVVSTSGTAVLNLAPAVAEAYYQHIPLIVFTADRPLELVDQGDGQTIHQRGIFGTHVKLSVELPVETSNDADLWLSDRLIAEAIGTAIQNPAAPVHINVPLREPLYTPLPEPVSPKIIRTSPTIATLNDNQWQNIAHEWNRAQKKLVIAGGMFNNNSTLNTLLGQLAQRSDTLVVAENLSNLYHENFIFDPEKFLAVIPEAEKQYLQPDLLVTFGNSVVSKRLKLFLRNFRPSAHWLIDAGHAYTDTYQSLTRILPLPAETFFQSLLSNTVDSVSNYSRHFLSLHKTIQHQAEKILASLPFCDLTAVHFILNHLKEGTNLHLANSMPVRYAQLFRTRAGIRYYSNRGTSGIDGCTSTCAGMAAVSDSGAVLITGDLAFLYDSNALWNNHLDSHLKIIVLNNGGGNIFQMIDTSPEIEPILNYFTTPHSVNLKNLVEAFGLQYFRAASMEQLNDCFPSFLEANVPAVLEITTDPEVNTQIYKTFIKSLQL